jgi:hypothetical protein
VRVDGEVTTTPTVLPKPGSGSSLTVRVGRKIKKVVITP